MLITNMKCEMRESEMRQIERERKVEVERKLVILRTRVFKRQFASLVGLFCGSLSVVFRCFCAILV